jgi:hypothetical protein
MNNENTNETRFNWTGGSWPAYCTTILNGRVVGKVWRGDDGLLHAMVLKSMSKGFETIGYYIDLYCAQDAVERWVTNNREGLVSDPLQATQGQEAHGKTKRWKVEKDSRTGHWSAFNFASKCWHAFDEGLTPEGAKQIEDIYNKVLP